MRLINCILLSGSEDKKNGDPNNIDRTDLEMRAMMNERQKQHGQARFDAHPSICIVSGLFRLVNKGSRRSIKSYFKKQHRLPTR